jgi:hypothetical protein
MVSREKLWNENKFNKLESIARYGLHGHPAF